MNDILISRISNGFLLTLSDKDDDLLGGPREEAVVLQQENWYEYDPEAEARMAKELLWTIAEYLDLVGSEAKPRIRIVIDKPGEKE